MPELFQPQHVESTGTSDAGKTLKILLIEDNQDDAGLITEMLHQADNPPDIVHLDNLPENVDYLKRNEIDLILLDLGLPSSQGLDTFRAIRNMTSRIPVIILTALNELSATQEAGRPGAATTRGGQDAAPRKKGHVFQYRMRC